MMIVVVFSTSGSLWLMRLFTIADFGIAPILNVRTTSSGYFVLYLKSSVATVVVSCKGRSTSTSGYDAMNFYEMNNKVSYQFVETSIKGKYVCVCLGVIASCPWIIFAFFLVSLVSNKATLSADYIYSRLPSIGRTRWFQLAMKMLSVS